MSRKYRYRDGFNPDEENNRSYKYCERELQKLNYRKQLGMTQAKYDEQLAFLKRFYENTSGKSWPFDTK